MTTPLIEACARAVHGALSRANITAYLDMPDDTAEIVARAVIPLVLERAAEVARQNINAPGWRPTHNADVYDCGWNTLARFLEKEILALKPEAQS